MVKRYIMGTYCTIEMLVLNERAITGSIVLTILASMDPIILPIIMLARTK